MKRITLTLLAVICFASAFGQGTAKPSGSTIQTISVSSKGKDVRDILSDVFTQADKSFVVQPNIHFALFLSLKDVEFEEALNLICKTASLKYELQNGIYFVSRDKAPVASPPPTTPDQPTGKLSPKALGKKVTLRLKKADLKTLFAQLSAQSGITLDVDSKVPEYKADVVLNGVTLKYALTTICRVANLTYRFSDHMSVLIIPREDPNQAIVRIDPH